MERLQDTVLATPAPSRALGAPSFASRLAALLVALLLAAPGAGMAAVPKKNGDLRAEVAALIAAMPGPLSEGFWKPSAQELADWRALADALVDGEAERADSVRAERFPSYLLSEYEDEGGRSGPYYFLREPGTPALAWGALLLNTQPDLLCVLEAPHANYDYLTGVQSVDLLRGTGALLLLLNGADRCANDERALCDGATSACSSGGELENWRVSDVAHFPETCFQTAHEVAVARFPIAHVVSVHGNTRGGDCGDVFLSSGLIAGSRPVLFSIADRIDAAQDSLLVVVADPGVPCALVGSTNAQGRHVNGAADLCLDFPDSTNGRFIHLEQSLRVRESADCTGFVAQALAEALAPVTPTLLLSFEVAREAGGARLRWALGDPGALAGLELLREEAGGGLIPLTPGGLPALGSGEWFDLAAPAGGAVYHLREFDGGSMWLGSARLGADGGAPALLALAPPHPNPSRAGASARLSVGGRQRLRVAIFDLGGRRVREIADRDFQAGEWTLAWDGRDDAGRAVPVGVYLLRVEGMRAAATRKLLVLR